MEPTVITLSSEVFMIEDCLRADCLRVDFFKSSWWDWVCVLAAYNFLADCAAPLSPWWC